MAGVMCGWCGVVCGWCGVMCGSCNVCVWCNVVDDVVGDGVCG